MNSEREYMLGWICSVLLAALLIVGVVISTTGPTLAAFNRSNSLGSMNTARNGHAAMLLANGGRFMSWGTQGLVANTARTVNRVSSANAEAVPPELDVTLSEFKVDLSATTIPANTPIRIVVTNNGKIEHEAVLEKAGADDEAIEIDEANEQKTAEIEHVQPGETRSVVWVIPEVGEYQFACHIPGHYEAGMSQRITIVAAPSPQLSAQTKAVPTSTAVSTAVQLTNVAATPTAATAQIGSPASNPNPAATVMPLLPTTGADEGSALLFFLILAGMIGSVLVICGLLILSGLSSK